MSFGMLSECEVVENDVYWAGMAAAEEAAYDASLRGGLAERYIPTVEQAWVLIDCARGDGWATLEEMGAKMQAALSGEDLPAAYEVAMGIIETFCEMYY